jgi:hypothetical protein
MLRYEQGTVSLRYVTMRTSKGKSTICYDTNEER